MKFTTQDLQKRVRICHPDHNFGKPFTTRLQSIENDYPHVDGKGTVRCSGLGWRKKHVAYPIECVELAD